VTAADDEDKANTGEEEPKLLEKRELLEERELLEDAGYTIAPLRRLQLEITAGTLIIFFGPARGRPEHCQVAVKTALS
jgi:hypothetical protein